MQEKTELFISVVDPNTGILYLDPDPEICPKFGSEDPSRFNRLMNKFRLNIEFTTHYCLYNNRNVSLA